MRKIYLLLVLMLSSLMAFAQAPQFTAEGASDADAHWYYIQFERGDITLGVNASNKLLQTKAVKNDAGQEWKFVGTEENFKLVNKKTQQSVYLDTKGTAEDGSIDGFDRNKVRFVISDSKATEFKLHDLGDGYYEIRPVGAVGDQFGGINLCDGASVGNPIGIWRPDDPNNKLKIVTVDNLIAEDIIEPVFSTDDNETWFYLQFERGGIVIGLDESDNLIQMEPAKVDGQQWKLVGDASSLKLINKKTGKAVFYDKKDMPKVEDNPEVDNVDDNPSRFILSDDGSELVLVDLGGGIYELQPKGETFNSSDGEKKLGMNLWLGASEGNPLGAYTEGDGGNKFKFVMPDAIETIDRVAPELSTEDKDNWYYIRFMKGSGVLESKGEGQKLMTGTFEADKEEQQWKLVGVNRYNVEFVCKKDGLHIYYNEADQRFYTAKDQTGELKLKGSTNTQFRTSWCIGVQITVNAAGQTMNQHGGQGVGKELGLWNNNDPGNALEFIKAESIQKSKLPVFSSQENGDNWYQLKFKTGENVIEAKEEGADVLVAAPEEGKDAQLWRLVGEQENFKLVSKTGLYFKYNKDSKTFIGSTEQSGGLILKETPNLNLLPAWEIFTPENNKRSVNQNGGAEVGKNLALWRAGDINNPLTFEFVKKEDYTELPGKDPSPVVAIEKDQSIAVAGRTVTLAEAQKVVVYTITGVKVLETNNATFTIPAEAGSVVILKTAQGVIKLAL